MKLNPKVLRYMSAEEFRVLTAVEMGMKNHEVVPMPMIASIAGLRHGGSHKLVGELARNNLIARVQNVKYDGYRLTYGGFDYLALKAFTKRGSVHSVGQQIGVGKESDIYLVADEEGTQFVLKIQRLGRISFRSIKNKRDYLQKRKSASWMYMSRLAAIKEYAFMRILYDHGFPVPRPIDHSRHCVVMELVDGYPLQSIEMVPEPGRLYSQLMDMIVRLAESGLIHGDFNEFNIMIHRQTSEPILIDFPQMVSVDHANAEFYFNRDVDCIRTFFRRRFGYESRLYPRFSRNWTAADGDGAFRLDVMVAASGFTKKQQKELEEMVELEMEGKQAGEGSLEESREEQDSTEEEEELTEEEWNEFSSSESEQEEDLVGEEEDKAEEEEATNVTALRDALDSLQVGKQDSAASESESESESDLEPLNNHQQLPFRDSASPSFAATPKSSNVGPNTNTNTNTTKPAMSQEELKRRVKRSLVQSQKRSGHSNARRNQTKSAGKRRDRDAVKAQADVW